MSREIKSREIKIHNEKCVGCGTCELWCSFTFQKAFIPLLANIHQSFVSGEGFKISFTEDCTQCGICAGHCVYGALEIVK